VRLAEEPKGNRMAEQIIGVKGNEATRKKLAGVAKGPIAVMGNEAVKADLVELAKTGSSGAKLKGSIADRDGHKVLVLAEDGSKS